MKRTVVLVLVLLAVPASVASAAKREPLYQDSGGSPCSPVVTADRTATTYGSVSLAHAGKGYRSVSVDVTGATPNRTDVVYLDVASASAGGCWTVFLGSFTTDASGNGSLSYPGVLLPDDTTAWNVRVSDPIGISTDVQHYH